MEKVKFPASNVEEKNPEKKSWMKDNSWGVIGRKPEEDDRQRWVLKGKEEGQRRGQCQRMCHAVSRAAVCAEGLDSRPSWRDDCTPMVLTVQWVNPLID